MEVIRIKDLRYLKKNVESRNENGIPEMKKKKK